MCKTLLLDPLAVSILPHLITQQHNHIVFLVCKRIVKESEFLPFIWDISGFQVLNPLFFRFFALESVDEYLYKHELLLYLLRPFTTGANTGRFGPLYQSAR